MQSYQLTMAILVRELHTKTVWMQDVDTETRSIKCTETGVQDV